MKTDTICLLTCMALSAPLPLAAIEPSRELLDAFEKEIRPVLAEHCYQCHGPDKQEGELRLDSSTAILRGGASGNTVVPQAPDQSLLVKAIGYADEALQMPPPPNKRLRPDQTAAIIRWIQLGAAMPNADGAPVPQKYVDDERVLKGKEFWAFRPPITPPPPDVSKRTWVLSAIDPFVLGPLEHQGISPVKPAEKQALIRRATFDVTGLPPAPQEVDLFVNSDVPDAWDRLLDRLLASPRYGERWGRHWLDIARYADSNGLDENVAFGNAWRFRDYVVDSWNRDKPFDQFIVEQLAGDLISDKENHSGASTQHERLIATGFLTLGPKVLAEVDEQKMEMDIVDEQIDSFGKAVLGLTLGCARCHDHKFDPISTDDYYALAGIFKSTRTMEHFTKVARWYENPIATLEELGKKAEHDEQVQRRKSTIEEVKKVANEKLKQELKPGEELPSDAEVRFPTETKSELKRLREELVAFEKTAPEVTSAMGATEGKVADVPIHVRGSHLTLGKTVPRRVPRVLADPSEVGFDSHSSGRLQLARWLVQPHHPLTGRVLANRIWRWHFGKGLVRSTDNFGMLGEIPVNPQLLDWLATSLVRDQWSLKRLHRVIMLSATYQLSSENEPALEMLDPDNRLLGRAEVRRLEAEAIRDSLLFVSGRLDTEMGGSLSHVKNRDYFFNHTSQDKTSYDSRRRSLYLPVVRNNLYDVFQLFDYADAAVLNGNRDTTTVAPQALFMMNSELVYAAASAMADDLLHDLQLDENGRLREMYARALARSPTDSEMAVAERYLSLFDGALKPGVEDLQRRRQKAWTLLCQTVLAANEFVYVR